MSISGGPEPSGAERGFFLFCVAALASVMAPLAFMIYAIVQWPFLTFLFLLTLCSGLGVLGLVMERRVYGQQPPAAAAEVSPRVPVAAGPEESTVDLELSRFQEQLGEQVCGELREIALRVDREPHT